MSMKIEVEIPHGIVADGNAGTYLQRAMTAIGYVPSAAIAGIAAATPAPVKDEPEATPVKPEEASKAADAPVARERGKPAPGRARRTKEEIAEDEAADAAEAAAAAEKPAISTGEERVDPADVAAQDKADEQAEVEANRDPEKPVTVDDVKAVVNQYVEKFGLPATQEDGPKIFVEALGAPPKGEPYWKMSLLPDDQEKLRAVVQIWQKAVELNPLKREAV